MNREPVRSQPPFDVLQTPPVSDEQFIGLLDDETVPVPVEAEPPQWPHVFGQIAAWVAPKVQAHEKLTIKLSK